MYELGTWTYVILTFSTLACHSGAKEPTGLLRNILQRKSGICNGIRGFQERGCCRIAELSVTID